MTHKYLPTSARNQLNVIVRIKPKKHKWAMKSRQRKKKEGKKKEIIILKKKTTFFNTSWLKAGYFCNTSYLLDIKFLYNFFKKKNSFF